VNAMRVVARPVDMLAWFDKDGIPNPLRFRFSDEDECNLVIKVDKIINRDKEKLAGNEMILFRCQSLIDGIEKVYELKFEIRSCRWMIYKM
jgi:hypothetical protein